ncbi:biliverdin-producing heme oxygenase [Camelimonas abortus]|uniref:biliverdin-producing heme oxygenase n=1 Tax=Camelimonas abortus TaxID=1017184 RepID=UPI0035E7BB89
MTDGTMTLLAGRPQSLRHLLRAATAADHARVDAGAARHDLSTRDGYRAFLLWQARVLPGFEALFDAAAGAPPDWPERRRAPALRADLAALGAAMPAPAPVPALEGPAARLGALYVLEGSRLGGLMLARTVRSAWPDAPLSFLEHGATARLWPRFTAWLDAHALSPAEQQAMTRGARAAFAAFLAALDG